MLTSRTLEGRFYLVPDRPEVNEIIVGVVARAQRNHAVAIHGLVFMSNHFHMVVTGDNPEQIAAFMKHVKGNLTREINKVRDRSGTMWHRRYDLERADDDERSHVEMLAYVLAHGAKEGLVESPGMWPGVNSARELLDGADAATGVWTRRTAMGRTTTKVVAESPDRFRVKETVDLTPLPTLAHFSEEERREALRIAVEAAIARRETKNSNPARTLEEAQRRARRTDWRRIVGSPAGKHLRARRPARWRRSESVEQYKAIARWYAEASRAHRDGLACTYPPWTIPAPLRMGERRGLPFKRLSLAVRKEWKRRAKTGVRQRGAGTRAQRE